MSETGPKTQEQPHMEGILEAIIPNAVVPEINSSGIRSLKWFWLSIASLLSYVLYVVASNYALGSFAEHIEKLDAQGVQHIGADWTSYFFFAAGAAVVGLIIWASQSFRLERSPAGISYSIIFGLLGGIGQFTFFKAFETGGDQSAVITAITGLYGALTAVLVAILFKERMSRFQLLGLMFGASSIVVISLAPQDGSQGFGLSSVNFYAPWFLATMVSLLCWGALGIFQKLAAALIAAKSTIVWQSVGYALLIPFAIPGQPFSTYPVTGIVWGLLSGAFINLAVLFLVSAIKNGGKASVVIPLTTLYPLLYAVAAITLFDEQLNVIQWASVAAAFLAVVLMMREPQSDSSAS